MCITVILHHRPLALEPNNISWATVGWSVSGHLSFLVVSHGVCVGADYLLNSVQKLILHSLKRELQLSSPVQLLNNKLSLYILKSCSLDVWETKMSPFSFKSSKYCHTIPNIFFWILIVSLHKDKATTQKKSQFYWTPTNILLKWKSIEPKSSTIKYDIFSSSSESRYMKLYLFCVRVKHWN